MFIVNILKSIMPPLPELFKANKLVDEKIKKLMNPTMEEPYSYDFASVNNLIEYERLEEILKDTIEEKKIIEDKTKSTLVAITISSTLIVNLLNILKDIDNNFFILVFPLSIASCLSLLYMIVAGMLSLHTIGELNKIAVMFPEDYALDEYAKKAQIADNIEFNYLANLKRNNFMATSYKCIKISLSFLIIIFIVSITVLNM